MRIGVLNFPGVRVVGGAADNQKEKKNKKTKPKNQTKKINQNKTKHEQANKKKLDIRLALPH